MRGRAAVAVLVLALVAGGVTGWSLRGDGNGARPAADRATSSPSSGSGAVATWIEGTVREGGQDFALLDVPSSGGGSRVVRIGHVRWRTAPGVHLVVPPPRGMSVCARVLLRPESVRSGDYSSGEVFEGARCSVRGIG